MNKFRSSALLCLFILVVTAGCQPDANLDPQTSITFHTPEGWPEPAYKFEGNSLSQAGFELGKKIFYDPRLSRDNSVSCGSCHQQFSAFAQLGHNFSHGVDNKLGNRNSPALFNLNWHHGFFWDGGSNHIEVQPINPIQNPVEMDENLNNVVAKLAQDPEYKNRFKEVFGDETINSQRMLKALAQFMGMLVSDHSRYDKYITGAPGGSMSDAELRGLSVYRSKCSGCHTDPLFSDYSYRNNGLPVTALNDSGRARITLLAEDMHKFKVPSLRNLRYTAPYMHDGRFNTLNQVLDHYTSGIVSSATLDPLLQNGITLSAAERSDLLEFLNTLNDDEFISDKRFAQSE